MTNNSMKKNIESLVLSQKQFFLTQKTKETSYRKELLKLLYSEIKKNETAICKALQEDFKKHEFETLLYEIQLVLSDLRLLISKLEKWSKPKRKTAALVNYPSRDYIIPEPYGTVLIISPWNYPFQLAMSPLIAAVAAGNTVVLKPSELTPNTSSIIQRIINSVFKPTHVIVIEGDAEVAQELLSQVWDYIFFTGSPQVGKLVYKAAASNLTPVTLELGGKNPCIVNQTAELKVAAKRIVWGKFVNAGQTCIAPDYLLVDNTIATSFIELLKHEITEAYQSNGTFSNDMPAIISQKHFERLTSYLKQGSIIHGGKTLPEQLRIEPTLVFADMEDAIMQGEIFGPILPIILYKKRDEIDSILGRYGKPLAWYHFTSDFKWNKELIGKFSFGGGVINDVMIHFGNKRLPFGGVGNSGIGAYHGKLSFDTFTHYKPIVRRATWIDIPLKYAPYVGKTKWIPWIEKLL